MEYTQILMDMVVSTASLPQEKIPAVLLANERQRDCLYLQLSQALSPLTLSVHFPLSVPTQWLLDSSRCHQHIDGLLRNNQLQQLQRSYTDLAQFFDGVSVRALCAKVDQLPLRMQELVFAYILDLGAGRPIMRAGLGSKIHDKEGWVDDEDENAGDDWLSNDTVTLATTTFSNITGKTLYKLLRFLVPVRHVKTFAALPDAIRLTPSTLNGLKRVWGSQALLVIENPIDMRGEAFRDVWSDNKSQSLTYKEIVIRVHAYMGELVDRANAVCYELPSFFSKLQELGMKDVQVAFHISTRGPRPSDTHMRLYWRRTQRFARDRIAAAILELDLPTKDFELPPIRIRTGLDEVKGAQSLALERYPSYLHFAREETIQEIQEVRYKHLRHILQGGRQEWEIGLRFFPDETLVSDCTEGSLWITI
jgi:hypothetical protein